MLGPSGIWLLLLLVLPTLMIAEISFVPGLRPGEPQAGYGLGNYFRIFNPLDEAFNAVYIQVLVRSLFYATGTTLACLITGFPVAYWLALMAPRRWRSLLLVAFVLPLWTSSLLRAYAWIGILKKEGLLNQFLLWLGVISEPLTIMNTNTAVYIGIVYTYLPFMILPLQASLERVPPAMLEASGDLGARPGQTLRYVILPLALPGIIAGSIFTFSLTMGDYIVPQIVGTSARMIGQAVYQFQGTAGNIPLAAAFAVVPIVVMCVYLTLAKRAGAFEEL